ncbi:MULTISPECIES: F0F1 ATP synthase subunit B [Leptospira]|uniref:ATP synthase subunit b n=1 Tax=Leptospira congkakensis TaxID=2484932 RepID=A0A4Z1AHB2_9LEPT|nr:MULTISPECIES: F0F1 ATP synthase subunit B [Leptospira]MCG6139526.1 F0F1 ATP synthase subunit B [Leptospira mtsangambouensis]TGL87697.1 F0F1 ATP synthase subunit B [Leptospira congkakensis]TGL89687.1 F0F1 ATP synthase subunit B [Leptospira congkakensis]TGL95847.1 F0F1 ATP synthase subunit B [Leptospira congkakensis]
MVILAASGFNLLKVNPGLVIWTLVTFSVVVFVLKKFAWDKILHALEERASGIQGDINKAETLRVEAEKSLKEYKDQLFKATEEAHKIVDEAKKDAVALRTRLTEEAHNEVKGIKDNAIREIDLAKSRALSEMQNQIVEMSVLIASEILEKQLKKEDYASFVEKEIAKLDKLKIK